MKNSPRLFAPFLALIALLIFSALTPANATSSNSGIDTPTGTYSLPLSVQGQEMMSIGSTGGVTVGADYAGTDVAPANGAIIEGDVGIGVTSPGTGVALDVNGGIRGSNSAVRVNQSCPAATAEGMFGYDSLNQEPVYCSHAGTWSAFEPVGPGTIMAWCAASGSQSSPNISIGTTTACYGPTAWQPVAGGPEGWACPSGATLHITYGWSAVWAGGSGNVARFNLLCVHN